MNKTDRNIMISIVISIIIIFLIIIKILVDIIKNKNNKYMASDCPLAGKHLKQLEADTNISNDEAVHPIELIAKSYRL